MLNTIIEREERQVNMSRKETDIFEDTQGRILKLENTLEEFMVSVSEENLKLKVPYVSDITSSGISLGMDNENSGILKVNVAGREIGKIILSQEE